MDNYCCNLFSHSVENVVDGVRYFCSREALRSAGDCLKRFRGRCSSSMWSIQSSAVSSAALAERFTLCRASTRLSAIMTWDWQFSEK